MKPLRVLLTALFLPCTLPAQSTWIVDWTMGPGAHFQNIPEAVAAANPGDTILVRDTVGGRYIAPLVDKPLNLIGVSEAATVGGASVQIRGRWTIRDISSGRKLLISNIELIGPIFLPDPHGIECVNNAGSIHFEKVEMRSGGWVNGIARFENCADLSFHGCRLEAYDTEVMFLRSRVRLVDCDVFSSFPITLPPYGISQTADAMLVRDSHVTMSRSQAIGTPRLSGPGLIGGRQPARAGVHLESGTLVACADTRFLGGQSICSPPCFTNGIYGSGTLVLDPTVTWTSFLDPNLTVIRRHVPALRMDLAFRGSPVEVGVVGPAGGLALVAMGRPLPAPLPWPVGELWLAPGSVVPLQIGALDATTGRWDLLLPVCAPTPMDTVFAFQAAVLHPSGTIELTTPVSFSVQLALGGPMP